MVLACPECRRQFDQDEGPKLVCQCGRVYHRLLAGGIDFLNGRAMSDFTLDPSDPRQKCALDHEAAGVSWRVERFLLPLIHSYVRSAGIPSTSVCVLDCGCGNGLSVDILRAANLNAFGIDAGSARHQQWRTRSDARFFLHAANALDLPWTDHSFDVIISSGLIEHIGIHEEEMHGYRAHRLQDCHAQRERFIKELVRVLKPGGFILIDHPNGSFPADFWHGGEPGSIRWHWPFRDMLPRYGEIRNYFYSADPSLRLVAVSPARRLQFGKVKQHWYGVAFAPVVAGWLRLLERQKLSFFLRSFLNPYLVTIASRRDDLTWISDVS